MSVASNCKGCWQTNRNWTAVKRNKMPIPDCEPGSSRVSGTHAAREIRCACLKNSLTDAFFRSATVWYSLS